MFGKGRGACSLSWGWSRLHEAGESFEDSDSDVCGACGRMRYQHDEDAGCEFVPEGFEVASKKRRRSRKKKEQ